MEAIRLEFKSEIKEKILELLSSFSSDELKIVEEDTFYESDFKENKRKLHERAEKITKGTAQYSTFEELDVLLEKTISKYED
ncbi:hypothetical protein [Flavobacterium hydrophilum]|uniref:Uncharacterized protein n=1 Tax=Flavobacterium hydrophilum TaxID=2211445 RepID=A0A2V4C1C6_9FLAO|nr:hypothetical protein [Flavobacterium hydrophilum]PXY43690.1 hypothetical protein DMB68_19085 [Flavobacterium hydrophilum]